jgi:hypothetical protein
MPCIKVNICPNFKIGKIKFNFCTEKKEQFTEADFKLIKTKHKKYKQLVPKNNNYIYLKVLDTGEIISVIGHLLPFFNLKSIHLLKKHLNDIDKCAALFSEFIHPLYESCLEKNLAYQFDFELKTKRFSCSLYPCSVAEEITSVDIVIRYSHNVLTNDTSKFILV